MNFERKQTNVHRLFDCPDPVPYSDGSAAYCACPSDLGEWIPSSCEECDPFGDSFQCVCPPRVYYGCQLPFDLRMQCIMSKMHEWANYSRMNPQPVIVHPTIYAEWVSFLSKDY
jgi:hypothetical protein